MEHMIASDLVSVRLPRWASFGTIPTFETAQLGASHNSHASSRTLSTCFNLILLGLGHLCAFLRVEIVGGITRTLDHIMSHHFGKLFSIKALHGVQQA